MTTLTDPIQGIGPDKHLKGTERKKKCPTNTSNFPEMAAQQLIEANELYAATFKKTEILPRDLVIVSCLDPRIQPYEQLGFKIGAGGIIRNAGGSAHNALPGILVVQQNYGIRNIAVFHHTDCGMTKFTTEGMRDKVKKANPGREDVAELIDAIDFHHITDVKESVESDVKWLAENPLIVKGTNITGWVYDVDTGKISKVADVLV
ncbi:carbonic anhydrase [Mycena metata]|uniref:Carbonic anhydrase n=1 Tax=Mycena metata TaxID=1033252 RepID=A0AAD7P361_9AGAR|nr:carbonic anhydrase [Mycena metata]